MSARDDYPLALRSGPSVGDPRVISGTSYDAAMDELDRLRAENGKMRADLDVLRQALVRWKRRQPITTWEYIEFVLNLIPDDDWGIALLRPRHPHDSRAIAGRLRRDV